MKSKNQKGITLVALIITIIVLLVLAVVAIGAVQNDGIINHALNARNRYEIAQGNENIVLETMDNLISNYYNGEGGTSVKLPSNFWITDSTGKEIQGINPSYVRGTGIYVPKNGASVNEKSEMGEKIKVLDLIIPEGIERIASFWLPYGGVPIRNIILPSTLTTISEGAFSGFNITGEFNIPEGVATM